MMLRKQPKLAMLLFCATIASHSVVYADGFYTIIGPDGRPMIIPKKDNPQAAESKKDEVRSVEQQPHKQGMVIKKGEKQEQPVIPLTAPSTKSVVPMLAAPKSIQPETKKAVPAQVSEVETVKPQTSTTKSVEGRIPTAKNKETKDVIPTKSSTEHPLTVEKNTTQKIVNTVPETSKPAIKVEPTPAPKTSTGFTQVDGVEYVNNEYLEDQEFNLEGKKRFYSMPDGTGRFETIERKKGVTRSVLDKFMNRSQQSNAPIALASSYVRLSAQELSLAFENDRCFLDGYNKNKAIKTLVPQKDVGVWPRKPLKEKFEYELVKLDPAIQYIQLDSYASNNEKPVYYWPLVVFLDEKGCVQEGVSGFKNTSVAATLLQHASIQGVIKVPAKAHYIMMTPLASAVDVPEQELSDQGQIKIFALQ